MKMDAMQKRKMRKVAIVHFGLTLCVLLMLIFWHGLSATRGGPFNPTLVEQHVKEAIWFQFWFTILIFLQPVSYLGILILQHLLQHSILPTHPIWILALFGYGLIFLTVSLWSFCFGWLFVKLDNWLNQFPILVKKFFDLRFNDLTI